MTESERRCSDMIFLALCLWREGRGESYKARMAIAFCVMNRVENPSWWGRDVHSVVFKKWQFSSLTDVRDRQLTVWPRANDKTWGECIQIASDVLYGCAINPVPGADSYYDISIPPPYWAKDNTFVEQIGKLRFYNLGRDIETSET